MDPTANASRGIYRGLPPGASAKRLVAPSSPAELILDLINPSSDRQENGQAFVKRLERRGDLTYLSNVARILSLPSADREVLSQEQFLELIKDPDIKRRLQWALQNRMEYHEVKVYPSKAKLPKEHQLAWKLVTMASTRTTLDADVVQMIVNRVKDVFGVSIAGLNGDPVVIARSQAMGRRRPDGATIIGVPNSERFEVEFAAYANGTAGRYLDWHDTFLAADYSHPADTILPLLAVAQRLGRSGADLVWGIAVAYETQINLVRSISLHQGINKIDHIAHLAPAIAAGIGAMVGAAPDVIYQGIQEAVHTSFNTRQSRTAQISHWKAHAPAHAARLAICAMDRAMRGGTSPGPMYEGQASVIAHMLGGKDAVYHVPLPEPGAQLRAIMDSYPKQHSAEYQAQAPIDLAFRMSTKIPDLSRIREIVIHTSHHTHSVIGSGPNEPQKMDPDATRETLDHSLMYIFARALKEQTWHHVRSYEDTHKPELVSLWHKVRTQEDPYWTMRYLSTDPQERAYGARVEIHMHDGTIIEDSMAVANAHVLGATPWGPAEYNRKLLELASPLCSHEELARFLELVDRLSTLTADELLGVNLQAKERPLLSMAGGIL